mgnify:CR=1 FL=1
MLRPAFDVVMVDAVFVFSSLADLVRGGPPPYPGHLDGDYPPTVQRLFERQVVLWIDRSNFRYSPI